MITEEDLNKAIADCQGQRHPNANTCIKLAAYLTIKDALYGEEEVITPLYSFRGDPIRRYKSDTEFYKIAQKTDSERTMEVIDDLMSTIKATQPRLYASVMRKMRGWE